jgi:ArsR family transcriptional regulator, zinc-responsive transcriptional repressor
MVNQMNSSADSRASLPAGAGLGDAQVHAARPHGSAGHDHDPLDHPHDHTQPRGRAARDAREHAEHGDHEDHSHDLGMAMVGLDAPNGRATDQAPPAAVSSPPAAIAAFEAAGELLRALAAPVRIAIVVRLGAGPQCVHDLVESTGAPQPLISQHLRVLRGAGVVRGVRRGREIAYSLTDEHIGHIVADAISHAREAR